MAGKDTPLFGLSPDDASAMGDDAATRIRIFRALLLVTSELRAMLDQRLASDDLTTQQAAVLTAAKVAPTMTECADILGTSHQNVKQLALALERKGFLRIASDANDRRRKRLVLTAKNDRFWSRRNPGDHAAVLEAFADLSPAEAKALLRMLRKVHLTSRKLRGSG